HHLTIMLPRNRRQLPQSRQLAELRLIVGVGDGARPQTVTKAEGNIVGAHDLADFFEVRIEKILLMMREAPFRKTRSAAADNAGAPVHGPRNVSKQHAGMNREVVHSLLGLFNE